MGKTLHFETGLSFTEEELQTFLKKKVPLYTELEEMEDRGDDVSFLGRMSLMEDFYAQLQDINEKERESLTEQETDMIDYTIKTFEEAAKAAQDPKVREAMEAQFGKDEEGQDE